EAFGAEGTGRGAKISPPPVAGEVGAEGTGREPSFHLPAGRGGRCRRHREGAKLSPPRWPGRSVPKAPGGEPSFHLPAGRGGRCRRHREGSQAFTSPLAGEVGAEGTGRGARYRQSQTMVRFDLASPIPGEERLEFRPVSSRCCRSRRP